jgi:hypothetical protein
MRSLIPDCAPLPCRSRLAGDSSGSVDAFIDWTDAIASKPAPTGIGFTQFEIVGASLLAMDVNDNACCLNERVVQTLFAGKPAPTGNRVRFCFSPLIRPSVSSPSAFDLEVHAPSRGRVEVLRSGQPGKDAGLAAHGQGWPIAAGPRSRTGARACRA